MSTLTMSTLNCEYVDLSKSGSIGSLYSCNDNNTTISDSNKFYREEKDTTRINNISIQRGQVDYYIDVEPIVPSRQLDNKNSYTSNDLKNHVAFKDRFKEIDKKEGYKNYSYKGDGPGEKGDITTCPDGYSLINGKCEQKCINCKYQDNMKSMDMGMNVYDPCFQRGVYDGITNEGDIKCTCGENNKYCSDNMIKKFTTDGMLMDNNKIHMNIGESNMIDKLFNYDYL